MKKIETNRWKLKRLLQYEDKCIHNVICYMIWDNHNFKILENVDKVTVKHLCFFSLKHLCTNVPFVWIFICCPEFY